MSERFAFSIRDACRFSGIGRTSLFEMISDREASSSVPGPENSDQTRRSRNTGRAIADRIP